MNGIRLKNRATGLSRLVMAALISTLAFASPVLAESADVEATIEAVDTDTLTLTLDDGKTYQAPEEFNFEGLQKGVKVVVYYTVVDGKRVIDDLQVAN